jgi:hypothetical protein
VGTGIAPRPASRRERAVERQRSGMTPDQALRVEELCC